MNLNSQTFPKYLGKGFFGIVLQAIDPFLKETAVKFLFPTEANEEERKQTQREISLTRDLRRHPNIVQIILVEQKKFTEAEIKEVFQILPQQLLFQKYAYMEKAKLNGSIEAICIQMELCGESLRTWIADAHDRNNLQVQLKQIQIIVGIVRGLKHLHDNKIMHRDLKPENVMFATEGFSLPVKIGDFGTCRNFHSAESQTSKLTEWVGTHAYMAPEVRTTLYDYRADLFSLGLVIWEVAQLIKASDRRIMFDKLIYDIEEHLVENHELMDGISKLIIKLTKRQLASRMQGIHEVLEICVPWEEEAFTLNHAIRKAEIEYKFKMDQHFRLHQLRPVKLLQLKAVHQNAVGYIRQQFEIDVRQTTNIKRTLDDLVEGLFQKYLDDTNLEVEENMELVIGMDLGTENSYAAAYFDGSIIMIPDQNNKRKATPSYVLFESSSSVLVGDVAKDLAAIYSEQTVFHAKRLLGRNFADKILQHHIKRWPFQVVADSDNRPQITVGSTRYYPEQIISKIIEKLKADAEKKFNREITSAVITVPAWFTEAQKYRTRNSLNIAGLKIETLLTEPVAAVLAYGLHNGFVGTRNTLVYNLGVSFDVSILAIRDGDIKVTALGGDQQLGGVGFDNNMLNYCIYEFFKLYNIQLKKEGSPNKIDERIHRLRAKCEQAKIILSVATTTKILVDKIVPNLNLQIEITREQFNTLNESLFRRTITIVQQVLADAKMTVANIDEVVLVGGSTRIPKVQEMLKTAFPGKRLNMSLNPEEVVVRGAAILAATIKTRGT